MLEYLRKFQKALFAVVALILVSSFFIFGIFSTLMVSPEEERDEIVGRAVNGSEVRFSSMQKYLALLAFDENDDLLRGDFLESGIGALLASTYFEECREEFHTRWAQAKKYRPYAHPEAPFLSARTVWDQFYPELGSSLSALQGQLEASPETFIHLAKLYREQKKLSPEFVRRVLLYQMEKYPAIRPDQALLYQDFSLFGYKSARDWFGSKWLEKAASLIHNGALLAKEKGLAVSRQEAKESAQAFIQRATEKSHRSFQDELRLLGMTERELCSTWRKVLLFRRYLSSVGDHLALDHLVSRDLSSYTEQKMLVDVFRLPACLALKTAEDFFALQYYLDAVSFPEQDRLALPAAYLPLEDIAKRSPECVETLFTAQVARVSKEKIALRVSLQQVLGWAMNHWEALARQFPLLEKDPLPQDKRLEALERLSPQIRSQVDTWIRFAIVDEHPQWLEEAFQAEPLKEETFSFSAQRVNVPYVREPASFLALLELASRADGEALQELSCYSDGRAAVYRITEVKKESDLRIRPFASMKQDGTLARALYRHLEKQYAAVREKDPAAFKTASGEWKPFAEVKEQIGWALYADLCRAIEIKEKWSQPTRALYIRHRLAHAVRSASRRVQEEQSLPQVVEQFQLVREEKIVQRGVEPDWMAQEAFQKGVHHWSSVHITEEGQISFFYVKENASPAEADTEVFATMQTILAKEAMLQLVKHLIQRMQEGGRYHGV